MSTKLGFVAVLGCVLALWGCGEDTGNGHNNQQQGGVGASGFGASGMGAGGMGAGGTGGMAAGGMMATGGMGAAGMGMVPPLTMCTPACVAPQICDTTQMLCVDPPMTGCPGGCPDGQVCNAGACMMVMDGAVDAMCVMTAMARGNDQACADCVCTAGAMGCLAEAAQCDADGATCNDLITCGQTNMCNGTCCFCTDGDCGILGMNINTGPCSDEITRAVGLTPPADVAGALQLQMMCMAGMDSACAHAGALGKCVMDKCAGSCPPPPVCAADAMM